MFAVVDTFFFALVSTYGDIMLNARNGDVTKNPISVISVSNPLRQMNAENFGPFKDFIENLQRRDWFVPPDGAWILSMIWAATIPLVFVVALLKQIWAKRSSSPGTKPFWLSDDDKVFHPVLHQMVDKDFLVEEIKLKDGETVTMDTNVTWRHNGITKEKPIQDWMSDKPLYLRGTQGVLPFGIGANRIYYECDKLVEIQAPVLAEEGDKPIFPFKIETLQPSASDIICSGICSEISSFFGYCLYLLSSGRYGNPRVEDASKKTNRRYTI
jgi:hypothetical protein